jgi:thiamine biosynthesis lipoprotein
VLGKLIEIADNNRIDNMLINVGNSSIYAKGNHPIGVGWKIKIPENDTEIVLHNQCLTTSGNTELTKWPIMNPLNGDVVKNKKMVSVITKYPDVGEVLSKVSYLAPPTDLNIILERFDAKIVTSELEL